MAGRYDMNESLDLLFDDEFGLSDSKMSEEDSE